MVDTLYIDVPIQYHETLDNNSTTINDAGEIIYSNGYIGKIKVRKSPNYLRIEVSLSKLLLESNIYSISFQQMILALKEIEKELNIDIDEGIIRRLDIEYTFSTKYKPKDYFKHMGNTKYYTRSVTGGTSLYYKNNNREINIYDKIREVKNRRGIIPLEFTHKNMMRFECRYKNTFLKKFAINNGLNIIKIRDLMTPTIFLKLLDLSFKEYLSIYKESKTSVSLSSISTKKKMVEELASIGIAFLGGITKVEEMIDIAKTKSPKTHSSYFSRRKSEARQLAMTEDFIEKANIIEEINSKVNSIYLSRKQELNNFLSNKNING